MRRSMRPVRHYACAFILLAVTGAAACGAQSKVDDQTFLKLQHDWADARKNADMHFLENFYAREFSVGVMTGGESSREQDLAMFSSGDLKPTTIQDKDMKVFIYGTAAMVTGIEHLEGTYKGHPGQFNLRFTNVFVLRDDRWQIVRHQAAQIRD